MKRAFADSATVTVTIAQLPGQHVVGNPAARQCLPEAVTKRQQLDPLVQQADWAMPGTTGGSSPWSPFAVQQPLQPPQLCANLHAVNTPGEVGSSAAAFGALTQHLMPQQQGLQQFNLHTAGLCSTPQAAPGLSPHITTQLSSSQIPGLMADEAPPQPQQQQQPQLPALQEPEPQLRLMGVSHHDDATATATITLNTPAHKGKEVTQEHFLAELQAQLNMQVHTSTAQQHPGSNWAQQQQQQQPQPAPCEPLDELQLLLPAVHAEYKAEMQLMLRACQVASNVTKHSTATGCTLLLDPASREQLQRQVLANCNEKHAVVVAAFKHAAQAVENAAAASGCRGFIQKQQQQQQQQQPGSGIAASAGSDAGAAAAGSSGSMSEVWQALQQLRSSYQQELVAATSALFSICRGFGQRYALSPAETASIKAALAAAQGQHGRVEQLWQDIVLAAGGV